MDVLVEFTSSIILEENIKYSDIIASIGIVLFKSSQIYQIEKLIKRKCTKFKGVTLIKCGDDYWLLRQCDVQDDKLIQQIQRMVGLTETVVCIELSNVMQSMIQKTFCGAKNEASDLNLNNRLVFIKEIYSNRPSGSDIKYFKNIDEGIFFIRDKTFFITGPIMVVDLIQIYDCQKPFNIPKVRAIHRRYEQIRNAGKKISQIDALIFDAQRSKGQVVKQIQKMHFKKQIEGRFLWKVQQMHKYRTWLQQQNIEQVRCGRLTFLQLNGRINYVSMSKYNRQWRCNSFFMLKQLFNKIGGHLDVNGVKQFQRVYREMRNNLQRIRSMNQGSLEGRIYAEMIDQLDTFYKYHQDVLDGNSFSSIRFVKEEAGHIWRYRNNLYKKIAAFILFAGLAYCQDDFIRALTLYILSLITLAVRC